MGDADTWEGFWEQDPYGRQPMVDVRLELRGGRVQGSGRDVIGEFTFRGSYDADGSVRLVKQYLGKHEVLYLGQYDGEGVVFGQWSIGWDSGKFALKSPRHSAADAAVQELGR